jgi:hypothetical protein
VGVNVQTGLLPSRGCWVVTDRTLLHFGRTADDEGSRLQPMRARRQQATKSDRPLFGQQGLHHKREKVGKECRHQPSVKRSRKSHRRPEFNNRVKRPRKRCLNHTFSTWDHKKHTAGSVRPFRSCELSPGKLTDTSADRNVKQSMHACACRAVVTDNTSAGANQAGLVKD